MADRAILSRAAAVVDDADPLATGDHRTIVGPASARGLSGTDRAHGSPDRPDDGPGGADHRTDVEARRPGTVQRPGPSGAARQGATAGGIPEREDFTPSEASERRAAQPVGGRSSRGIAEARRPEPHGPARAGEIAGFLAAAGWGGAHRAPLAGDASGRRYERLTWARGGAAPRRDPGPMGAGPVEDRTAARRSEEPPGGDLPTRIARAGAEAGAPGRAATAVLMDAPVGPEGKAGAFLDVARRLRAMGLSAPATLDADPEAGLMLLEDLGDALLARVAAAEPEREVALYEAAADVLVRVHAAGPPEGLPVFDADAMAEAAALAGPWYARRGDAPWTEPLREALAVHAGPADTLILRDYHAENLIWLLERAGPARIGLLDFQDAMRGPAAYDLASLIADARRDVSPAAARAAVARFAEGTGTRGLDAALAVIGAQRALRILGIFGRLARRDGKPHYLALVPRVWGHLRSSLAHPACAGMRGPVLDALLAARRRAAGRAPMPPLMLFAAGFGRRMGRLTEALPKPLVRVAGRPLIDHALALADGAGIARRVANVHYRPEPLIRHLEARGVAVSREAPVILETGGGLRAALPLLGPGPVLTLNTDAVWRGSNPLSQLAAAWARAPAGTEALLLCIPLARALGRAAPGDFTLAPDGRLLRGGPLVYTGTQMIDPRALADVPDMVFSLNRVWDAMAARGALRGLVWPGAWCDVGRPEGIARAEDMLAQEAR